MRMTRLLTGCLALSLIVLAAIIGPASAGASAGVSAGSLLLDTTMPLVVEVKKGKSHHHGHSKSKSKNWSHRSGKKYYRSGKKYHVKRWYRRPHYGSVVAGVTLGTILGVAAAGVAPAPRGNLCWYWTDPAMRSGYWDYCY